MQDQTRRQKQSATRHGAAFWQEEKDNFGKKLMEKMGWEQGKGLGRKEEGATEFLRAKKRSDNLGIGAAPGTDEHWTAAQSMFNDLLKRLNQENDNTAAPTLEENEEEERRVTLQSYVAKRTLYSKFKRAKDIKNYSADAMSEIFGRKKSDPTPSPEPEKETKLFDTSLQTTTSTVNLKDYFASKLAKGNGANSTKSVTRFQSASGAGFTESQQTNYYEQMMSIAIGGQTGQPKSRGGLGFGKSHEEDEEEHQTSGLGSGVRGGLGFSCPPPSSSTSISNVSPSPTSITEISDSSSVASDSEKSERKRRKKEKKEKKRREAEEAARSQAEEASSKSSQETAEEEKARRKAEKKAAKKAKKESESKSESSTANEFTNNKKRKVEEMEENESSLSKEERKRLKKEKKKSKKDQQ